jgi:hypothetical protein
LLQDIESSEFGGFEQLIKAKTNSYLLSKFLDKRESTYGPRGGEYRSKLSKKVARWKNKFQQGVYESEILNFYGVTSFENQLKQNTADLSISEEDQLITNAATLSISKEDDKENKKRPPLKEKQHPQEKMTTKLEPGTGKFSV